jgi:hypothetical protein
MKLNGYQWDAYGIAVAAKKQTYIHTGKNVQAQAPSSAA